MTPRLVEGAWLTPDTVLYFGLDAAGRRILYPNELGGPPDGVPVWSTEAAARAAGAAGVEPVRARDAVAAVPPDGWLIRDPGFGALPLYAARRTRSASMRRVLGIVPPPRPFHIRRLRFARPGRFSPITQWVHGRPVVIAVTPWPRRSTVHVVRARDADDVDVVADLVEARMAGWYTSTRVLIATEDDLPAALGAYLGAGPQDGHDAVSDE